MAHVRETELDVHVLTSALWRRKWLLAILTLLTAALTYVALSFVPPIYTADTRILIEERESPLTRPRDASAESASQQYDESAILSQVEVLRSREIANTVVDRLDLTSRAEFDPARRPSLISSLLVLAGIREHPVDTTIRQRVMATYFERLSVYPIARSRVIGVEFDASNPQLAADVANAVADAFIVLQQQAKRETSLAATDWLAQEIERLRSVVAEAEAGVAQYRNSAGLFDTSQPSGNLSTQQLSDINSELARARAARAEAEARAQGVRQLLRENGAVESAPEVLNSQLIQRLSERQVALRAQIAELSTTFLPSHPRIRALTQQLENLNGQIRQEAQKVLAGLDTAARIAAAREQSLVASLNEAKGDVSVSNEREIQLRALEREAEAQRALLESFLGRYREAVARTDSNYMPADARIISRAVPPAEPSFPKKTMMAVVAGLAILLLASAIVLIREFTSGRAFRIVGPYAVTPVAAVMDPVTGAPELVVAAPVATEPAAPVVVTERATVVVAEEPAVAVVSEDVATDLVVADLSEVVAVTSDDDATQAVYENDGLDAAAFAGEAEELASIEAEQEKPGTAEIAEILTNPAARLILFAGVRGGEGAGDIAYSSARIAGAEDIRLVLVDIGMVPAAVLGGSGEPGLGDLLTGEAAFGEVIRRDEESNVHVIPMGSANANPPLQRLSMVIGALTHSYDKVVVVADAIADWPAEFIRPDLVALVCGTDASEAECAEAYESALSQGARNALIVRYDGGGEPADQESEAA